MRPAPSALTCLAAVATITSAWTARAGDFDLQGNFAFSSGALLQEGFETLPEYVPGDADAGAVGIKGLVPLEAAEALEGNRVALVEPEHWWEWVSLPVTLPAQQIAVRARLWTRHQNVTAVFLADFSTGSTSRQIADLLPTGRCTSDGWVELETAPLSIDGPNLSGAIVALRGSGEVDALEVVIDGTYQASKSCSGAMDPVCGSDGPCLLGQCRNGAAFVPALPPPDEREKVVDLLESRLRYLFGGHTTRQDYLPGALAEITKMRQATNAWEFWNGFATATRKLHDWHTSISGVINFLESNRHLNLCFLEGDADLSHEQWPSDPQYLDLLVAYTGKNRTLGLKRGDRLVAVDGVHPIAWARSLVGVSWDWWQADDDRTNAEIVERLRGLIPKFARTFTVLRCNESSLTCSYTPEVLSVDSIPEDQPEEGDLVGCDNRPAYHLNIEKPPDPETHQDVAYGLFLGPIVDSQPGENIWGMTWDSLWGPSLTPVFLKLPQQFKDNNVRGLILDHRAGNGGTVDAPEALTKLVRDPFEIAIFPFVRPSAGFEGPADANEGLAIFNRYKKYTKSPDLTYTVGSTTADKTLPVALLIHRDGSASDYLPYGMKGAPKTRIFGPQRTAGAFSSFFNLVFWGNFSLQMASGDTICFDGEARIGHGVEPDEKVLPKQSDLIVGKDTIYERALQWVREELKP